MKTFLLVNQAACGSERTGNGARPFVGAVGRPGEALTADISPQPEDMARVDEADLRGVALEFAPA